MEPALSPVGLQLGLQQSGWHSPECFLRAPSVVVDQGDLPCCVSCALSTCMEALHPAWEQLAPLYHFHRFNESQGSVAQFSDMTLSDGLNLLASSGICLHRYYDYDYTPAGARTMPGSQAIADALTRTLPYDENRGAGGFAILSDDDRINTWKKTLLGGRPILVGFYLTPGYKPEMKKLEGEPLFGQPHAVAVLGYRETETSFLVQDSKGSDFGFGGQWWMPYDIVASNVVHEAFALGYPTA